MIRIASVLLVLFALVPSTAVRAEKSGANDAADGSEAGARASEACAGPLEGGIAQVVRDGAKSRLILNKGSKDCVKLGQSGSVAGIDELFTIVEVFPFRSIAVIDRASKTIPANGRVTIDRGAATGSDGVNPPVEACAGPLEGGIAQVVRDGAKSRLILNKGSKDCVKLGQSGSVAGIDELFTIVEVFPFRSIAVIDRASKTIPANGRVTIDRGAATGSDGVNPPAEACAGPLEGGIILVIPEGAKSKLILNRGSSGCVKPGQTGRIAGVDGIFTITEVHAWRAIAVIDADSKTLPAHGRVTIDRGPATPWPASGKSGSD